MRPYSEKCWWYNTGGKNLHIGLRPALLPLIFMPIKVIFSHGHRSIDG